LSETVLYNRPQAGIDTLDEVGCFGLTELGYGNNAVEMETTATYDPKTGKNSGATVMIFEIFSP
jgi:hypothetical protein